MTNNLRYVGYTREGKAGPFPGERELVSKQSWWHVLATDGESVYAIYRANPHTLVPLSGISMKTMNAFLKDKSWTEFNSYPNDILED